MTFSFGTVGFGGAIVAGLVLVIMGHPEPNGASPPLASNSPKTFVMTSVSVELPASEIAFPGPANAEAIAANCLSCHSAGMVLTQPMLPKAAWAGIVDKMIHAYKAPVAEQDVPAIVDYLQETKGAK